jgi:hypothetical protein
LNIDRFYVIRRNNFNEFYLVGRPSKKIRSHHKGIGMRKTHAIGLLLVIFSSAAQAHSLKAPDFTVIYTALGFQPGSSAKQIADSYQARGQTVFFNVAGLTARCLETTNPNEASTITSERVQIIPTSQEPLNCSLSFSSGSIARANCEGPDSLIKTAEWMAQQIGPADGETSSTYSTWYCSADKQCKLYIQESPGHVKVLFDGESPDEYRAKVKQAKDACRKARGDR